MTNEPRRPPTRRPYIMMEADRVWYHEASNGQKPDVLNTWKPHAWRTTGKVMPSKNPDLRFGKACVGVERESHQGFLIHGPFAPLHARRYEAEIHIWFDVRTIDSGRALVDVDISTQKGANKLAGYTFSVADVRAEHSDGEGLVAVKLDVYPTDTTNGVEIRAYWHGVGRAAYIKTDLFVLV